MYSLSSISSTRPPLANKSLNIPPRTKLNQWSLKNADGVTKKESTTAHSHFEMTEDRLDAHHTVGLPATSESIMRPKEGNWNCHASAEEFRPALLPSDQCIRNTNDACSGQNMQCGTNYKEANFNQVRKDCGSVQNSVHKGSKVENHIRCGGSSEEYSSQPSSVYENQLQGPFKSYSRVYCVSPTEQGKAHVDRTMENRCTRNGKTSTCSPVNSRDLSKDLGSPRPYANSCKWLQPLTLGSIDTFDMEERTCIQQPGVPSATAFGYRHLENFTNLPTSQAVQRSSSMVQPKSDLTKPYISNTNHALGRSLRNGKYPQRIVGVNGLKKPLCSDISSATLRRSPYLNVNNSTSPEENSINQCRSVDGKQIHDNQTSTSQLKYNQNNVTTSKMQKERDPFVRSRSLGFSRWSSDKPIATTVPELLQSLKIGEIWKKVVLAR